MSRIPFTGNYAAFENYVLTRVIDESVGLTDVKDSAFTQLLGSTSGSNQNIGLGGNANALSFVSPIGFNFTLDGIVYNEFVACNNGWMALVDPSTGVFTYKEVMANVSGSSSITGSIQSQAALLAPWFDALRNVCNAPWQLNSILTGSFTSNQSALIAEGVQPRPVQLNEKAWGVSYYNDVRSEKGRRLIVRWNELSPQNPALASAYLKFEVVLYENGTIEYRYVPRSMISATRFDGSGEGAAIGIFMPNGTYRFRDFSAGLGYRKQARSQYAYGGYVSSSYADGPSPPAAPYTNRLIPSINWPGANAAGCIFSFTPPSTSRRKVLPRKEVRKKGSKLTLPTVARTGDDRMGVFNVSFDDRRTPSYGLSGSNVTVPVNYPTTLPRLFGNGSPGVTQRQDLFNGDFLLTGNIVKSAVEPYLGERPQTYMPAFNEHKRHEQDYSTLNSEFFATGSSLESVGAGFNQSLKSKTQIRIQLPVDIGIQMPTGSCSIYYYNQKLHCWEVPNNAVHSTNSPGGWDWAVPTGSAGGQRIYEDARGFGPIGNVVSSGSYTPQVATEQTNPIIGAAYNQTNFSTALNSVFPKSLRNNDDYSPTSNESFTLPITSPFLLEKMVIDLPFAAGPGWFKDMTQCFIPLGSSENSFDFAGPGITIALSRQVQLSENSPTPALRDLIMTGTITHVNDNMSSVVLEQFPPYDNTYQIRPVGYLSYADNPSAVVTPNSLNQFTGSVSMNCQAQTAVGAVIKWQFNVNNVGGGNADQLLLGIMASPNINLNNVQYQTSDIAYISPFGRGGTGFQQAGRSILGKEYVTLQGLTDTSGLTAANPFYMPGGIPSSWSSIITSGSTVLIASTAVPLISHVPSPYLVMPGDKFVLSISKMRPYVLREDPLSAPLFSGSITHDVQLTPGTINITLYGSQVQEGVEFHDTLNQPLASDDVHEMLGAEPVLDQFEPSYRNEYSGSFTDNVVLGSMVSLTTNGIMLGNRARTLSKLNARNVPALTTNANDIAINPFKSYRVQPWYERVGSVRLTQFTDNKERFWDSLMPSISDCFAADGCGIFIIEPGDNVKGTFGDYRQVDPNVVGVGTGYDPYHRHVGWIIFDNMLPLWLDAPYNFGPIINGNWTKAFPFEPRYSQATRQIDISKSFIATYLYQYDGSEFTATQIAPTNVSGLIYGSVGYGIARTQSSPNIPYNSGSNFPAYCNFWFADCNLSALTHTDLTSVTFPSEFYTTGSATTNDISKGLFGFGDFNNSVVVNNADPATGATFIGTRNFPDSQDGQGPHPDGTYFATDNNYYKFSPIIRGWKYGVYSGIPTNSKAYWRRGKFGQLRDMLEQRPYTKYYVDNQQGPAAVTVQFIDQSSGKPTQPENTYTSNLHFECTSSIPFFDGVTLNRPTFTATSLNLHATSIINDKFGNIHIA